MYIQNVSKVILNFYFIFSGSLLDILFSVYFLLAFADIQTYIIKFFTCCKFEFLEQILQLKFGKKLLNSICNYVILPLKLGSKNIYQILFKYIPNNGSLIIGLDIVMTLRAFDNWVSTFKPPYIIKYANLTKGMSTINYSMSKPKQPLTNNAS